MKKIILTLMFTVAISATQIAAAADSSKELIPGTSDKRTFFTAGAGLAFYSGAAGWALNLGVLHELAENSSFFVGADVGLNFFNSLNLASAAGLRSVGGTGIQLLPTVVYRFDIAGNDTFYPYMGLSAGPNIFTERFEAPAGGVASSNTNLYFELLFRPGVFTHLSKTFALNLEAKMGVLRSDFIFLPQASLVISM